MSPLDNPFEKKFSKIKLYPFTDIDFLKTCPINIAFILGQYFTIGSILMVKVLRKKWNQEVHLNGFNHSLDLFEKIKREKNYIEKLHFFISHHHDKYLENEIDPYGISKKIKDFHEVSKTSICVNIVTIRFDGLSEYFIKDLKKRLSETFDIIIDWDYAAIPNNYFLDGTLPNAMLKILNDNIVQRNAGLKLNKFILDFSHKG